MVPLMVNTEVNHNGFKEVLIFGDAARNFSIATIIGELLEVICWTSKTSARTAI